MNVLKDYFGLFSAKATECLTDSKEEIFPEATT